MLIFLSGVLHKFGTQKQNSDNLKVFALSLDFETKNSVVQWVRVESK